MAHKASKASTQRVVLARVSTRGNAVTVTRVAPIGKYPKAERG